MTCQSENSQPSLFDEPRVALAPVQKVELATLVEVLLREIATALANKVIGHEQDHL